jgi:arabinofuranan 3-O-arabinosyltransferase
VVGAALGIRYLLRNRPGLLDAITVGTVAGGLILAGVVLSQNPWRSVDGYAGHSASVQLLALISVSALAASVASAEWRNSIPHEEPSTPPISA